MTITIYSLLMSFLWFNIFILLASFLRRKTWVIVKYSVLSLALFMLVGVMRIFIAFELPFAFIIRSYEVYPAIQAVFIKDLLDGFGRNIIVGPFEIVTSRAEIYDYTNIPIHINLIFLVVCIWIIGTIVFISRFIILQKEQYAEIKKLPIVEENRIYKLMDDVAGNKCNGYSIRIYSGIETPKVTGYFMPTILVPDEFLLLNDKDIKNVLRHEWQHFLNYDSWVKLLINVICCIFWWNPLIYLLNKDLDQTLEIKCDLKVVKKMDDNDKKGYKESLVKITNLIINKRPCKLNNVSGFTNASDLLLQRCEIISSFGKKRGKYGGVIFCTVIALIYFLSFAFVVQPYGDPPDDDLIEANMLQNTYIENYNGIYSMYHEGEFFRHICEDEMKMFSNTNMTIPIIYK